MAGGGARLRALIFDLDGTLAETEELHRAAFNAVFAASGLDVVWDVERYRALLTTTGGRQRMKRYFAEAGLPLDDDVIAALHADKNARYAELMQEGVPLRPGVAEVLAAARSKGLQLAIATTTSRANLMAFLDATRTGPFDVLVAGEDVARLKPDPEAYVLALKRLQVRPDEAIAFEDSRNGVLSALGAGIRTIATPGMYTGGQDFAGAEVIEDLAAFALP